MHCYMGNIRKNMFFDDYEWQEVKGEQAKHFLDLVNPVILDLIELTEVYTASFKSARIKRAIPLY